MGRRPPTWSALTAIVFVLGISTSIAAQEAITPMPVGVTLNGRELQRPGLVAMRGERLLVRVEDLRDWGVVAAFREVVAIRGEDYVDVNAVPGLSARLDAEGTTLLLAVDPGHLPRTHLAAPERAVPVRAAVPVAFIDYDLNFSGQNGHVAASAVFDAGFSGAWGVFGTSALIGSGRKAPVRLESAFTRDFPERNLRLAIGDTYTRAASWSQPARFGGIRFGTDFSLDPSQITFPLPSLSGSAVVPSTVELASRAAVQTLSVEPGRFAFDYRPRFTGAGEVTMIVRDLAGNERTVTRSFYSSTALLRPGLSEFSVEAGAMRQDYGYRSFRYDQPFAAASYRRGVTPALTLEARGEAGARTRMGGAGATLVVQPIGEIRVGGAVSQGDAGTGGLYQIQFQRLTPDYSLTASYRATDRAFRQVGDSLREREARRELAISGSLTLGRLGGVNAGYLRVREGGSRYYIASLGYSANIGPGFLSLGAQRFDRDDGAENSLFGTLTIPLGGSSHVGLFADNDRVAALYQKAAPPGRGVGYRLGVGRDGGQGAWLEGAGTLLTSAGQLDVAAASRGGGTMARLEARGALVATGGRLFATPGVGGGLAVVEVPGDHPVDVMLENQSTAMRAGAGRRAVITGLQPYVANRISINAEELPISGELGGVEQVVAPGWRKATRIYFGDRVTRPVRLRALDEAGDPLPPGLVVTGGAGDKDTEGEAMVTGYDGEVFLSDFAGGTTLLVDKGDGRTCRIVLPKAPPENPLAQALSITCAAILPKTGR